jgi:uncharacterized membrane protein YeaQ/YmgE (transglycosylase-associated protein family)
MYLLAELTMSPGGVLAWIGVGLMAGWMAGLMMSGGGLGVIADIALGLVGAIVGGIVASFFIAGNAGFWASLLISLIGACMVIGIARILIPGRTGRV